MNSNRIVAIRIRSLRTTEGEARPSEACVLNLDSQSERFDLCDQQAEVDFLLGIMPRAWRKVEAGENIILSTFAPHHLKWVGLEPDKVEVARVEGRILREEPQKKGTPSLWFVLDQISVGQIGLKPGDRVAMMYGGAGELFARDMVEYWNGELAIWRITPHKFKALREAADQSKDNDVELLATTLRDHPEFFHLMRPIDGATATLSVVFDSRQEAMKQRIRAGNRLAGRARNALLRERRAGHPVDTLEVAVEKVRASDALYRNLLAEEARAEKDLAELLDKIEIWKVVSPVKGLGVSIGSRIIAAVGDIRRFMVEPNKAELAPLKAELDRLMQAADYQTTKGLMNQSVLASAKNGFERTVLARGFCLENDMTSEAELLQQALEIMKQIRRLECRANGESMFVAYCGLHVLPDGRFPRRRSGETSNWNPVVRQAFFLLTEQFNRRPDTEWGKKLLANKAGLRARHPDIVIENNKKRYTPGHILKMARWRTATQFARWFYREWVKLERAN